MKPTVCRLVCVYDQNDPKATPRAGLVVAAHPQPNHTIIVRIYDPSCEMRDTQRVLFDEPNTPSPSGLYWDWPPRT